MRGQISVEYLIIIGIALGILIPGILFFYTYSQSSEGSTTNAHLNDVGLKMVATAKGTYAQGIGAWQTLEVTLPPEVTRVYVSGTELVFVYDTPSGLSEAVFFSTINMTSPTTDGNITAVHPGVTRFRFTSEGPRVLINETA
jgi:hypothetical protein